MNKKIKLEDAITRLEEIVSLLENGNDDLEKIIQFQFSHEPDNLIRVFYIIEEYQENRTIKTPQIPSFKREGFTILEWGVVY